MSVACFVTLGNTSYFIPGKNLKNSVVSEKLINPYNFLFFNKTTKNIQKCWFNDNFNVVDNIECEEKVCYNHLK